MSDYHIKTKVISSTKFSQFKGSVWKGNNLVLAKGLQVRKGECVTKRGMCQVSPEEKRDFSNCLLPHPPFLLGRGVFRSFSAQHQSLPCGPWPSHARCGWMPAASPGIRSFLTLQSQRKKRNCSDTMHPVWPMSFIKSQFTREGTFPKWRDL